VGSIRCCEAGEREPAGRSYLVCILCRKCYIAGMKSLTLSMLQPQDLHAVADAAEISRSVLRQYASGYRTPSAARAIKIERAAKRLGFTLLRSGMSPGCGMCEYAKQCERAKLKGTR
jgi:transcriptional regulator with XRE-family HTH domain